MIGRWSELRIGSVSLQDVFADQLLPQRQMSEVLSLRDSTSLSSRAIIKNM